MDFDEAHTVEERKRVRISFQLLARRHLPKEATKWPHQKLVEELLKVTHVRLDRENISIIDNFELLGPKVSNLYLQHNKIEKIENLECLQNLAFLTLSANQIRRIEGLTHLKALAFLDLSENLIQTFDIDELPQSLVILSLKDNPCTHLADYRGRIIQDLPRLRQLDGEEVGRQEREEAGYKVSSDEEDEEEDEDENTGGAYTSPARELKIPAFGKSVDALLSSISTDIMLRSQTRMEDFYESHMKKLSQLDQIRLDSDLPPSPRSNAANTARGETPKSTSRSKSGVVT